ncbi:MAG TPA: DUF5777 family beta-barrel protein [Vicinamibacterales bacterium]|jgi:hypothetical protein
MQMSVYVRAATVALLVSSYPVAAQAQEAPPLPPEPGKPEVELNTVNLPTTLSLKRHQSYFRITHRFTRDLRRGDFGSLVEDLFSLDNGAVIGLEYRFGITDDLQAGVYRTALSKTIQFFGRYDWWRQGDVHPVAISGTLGIEALGNFQDNFQPSLAATVSRVVNSHVVLYATPAFVFNTRAVDTLEGHDHDLPGAEEDEHSRHEHTMLVGLGARVRFRPTAYVVGEYSPRLAGHDPGRSVWGVAIEKVTRDAKHTFQLNFTNASGSTLGQLSRGGSDHEVFLGFNLTRKF